MWLERMQRTFVFENSPSRSKSIAYPPQEPDESDDELENLDIKFISEIQGKSQLVRRHERDLPFGHLIFGAFNCVYYSGVRYFPDLLQYTNNRVDIDYTKKHRADHSRPEITYLSKSPKMAEEMKGLKIQTKSECHTSSNRVALGSNDEKTFLEPGSIMYNQLMKSMSGFKSKVILSVMDKKIIDVRMKDIRMMPVKEKATTPKVRPCHVLVDKVECDRLAKEFYKVKLLNEVSERITALKAIYRPLESQRPKLQIPIHPNESVGRQSSTRVKNDFVREPTVKSRKKKKKSRRGKEDAETMKTPINKEKMKKFAEKQRELMIKSAEREKKNLRMLLKKRKQEAEAARASEPAPKKIKTDDRVDANDPAAFRDAVGTSDLFRAKKSLTVTELLKKAERSNIQKLEEKELLLKRLEENMKLKEMDKLERRKKAKETKIRIQDDDDDDFLPLFDAPQKIQIDDDDCPPMFDAPSKIQVESSNEMETDEFLQMLGINSFPKSPETPDPIPTPPLSTTTTLPSCPDLFNNDFHMEEEIVQPKKVVPPPQIPVSKPRRPPAVATKQPKFKIPKKPVTGPNSNPIETDEEPTSYMFQKKIDLEPTKPTPFKRIIISREPVVNMPKYDTLEEFIDGFRPGQENQGEGEEDDADDFLGLNL